MSGMQQSTEDYGQLNPEGIFGSEIGRAHV